MAEAMSAEGGEDTDKNDYILFKYFGALAKGNDGEAGVYSA